MTDQRADDAIKRQGQLAAKRATWESHWQEIADRVLPRQAAFVADRTPGAKRTEKIFDSTAPLALERFAAAMEGMLTPRGQRWHHLRASDPRLNEIDAVRVWFERAEDILFARRYSPDANYASQQHEVYMSLGAFGSGVLFLDEITGRGLRYRAIHLAECFFAEDSHGRIDTNYRKFRLSARQAAQHWGAQALPRAIRDAVDREPDKEFEFLHCVFPRGERKAGRRDRLNMPFASLYIAIEGRRVIEEGGFEEFPYAISRYVTAPREVYGRSPAMQVLADIKMLNEMAKTTLRAAHKAVDPPLLVADDGVMSRINTRPNALNFGGINNRGQALVQPLQTAANVPLGLEMENQRRQVINDAFLVTLFQILVEQPSQTATEALIRAQEKGVLLAPTVGRQQSEALGPMIAREIAILGRAGRLPPLPPVLADAGDGFEIEYSSPLSRAQRAEEAVGIVRTLEAAAPLAQADPGVLDNIDGDTAMRALAEINGARRILRGRDQVEAARTRRQAAQGLEQLAAAAPSVAGAVKDIAQAEATIAGGR
ncbi:MAG: phage head-tail adapter protein [Alphaproteobacteria bacterium]|nr:phage head-tail adapter protein [Alphaproteobacteria bacterium]